MAFRTRKTYGRMNNFRTKRFTSRYKSRTRFSKKRKTYRKSRLAKKVKRMIMSSKPTKKANYQNTTIGIASNELTVLLTNCFYRVQTNLSSSLTVSVGTTGGDANATSGSWTGDTINGNKVHISGLNMRGVLRNNIYSPTSFVRLYLVRCPQGQTPTISNLYMGLSSCKLIDRFNYDNWTLIAQKDFRMAPASHTGNFYLPQSKPGGGTGANDATGTYWDTPGVGILGNTNTTYVTENVVYFNANTTSGSFAPVVVPFEWHISSAKLKTVTFNAGTGAAATTGSSGYAVAGSTTIKDWTYSLISYCYTNALVGSTPTLNSVTLDEFTWEYRFKELH